MAETLGKARVAVKSITAENGPWGMSLNRVEGSGSMYSLLAEGVVSVESHRWHLDGQSIEPKDGSQWI
eukprot:1723368-Amphidinium_carterae.2